MSSNISKQEASEWAKTAGKKAAEMAEFEGVKRSIYEVGTQGLFQSVLEDGGLGEPLSLSLLPSFGYGCQNGGLLLSYGAHCFAVSMILKKFSSNNKNSKILDDLISGASVGAFAATEADSGSDVMALKTRCKESSNSYKINGSKTYVTNAPIADCFIVFATKDERLNFRGVSAFIIPSDTKGITVTTDKTVFVDSDVSLGTVYFDDVVISKNNLIGQKNGGWKIFNYALICERVLMSGFFVGIMQKLIDTSIDHLKETSRFGEKLSSNPILMERIVTMKRAEYTSRLLFNDACRNLFKGNITDDCAAMTKLHVSESLFSVSISHLRNFGGASFLGKNAAASTLLHSASSLIYSGTSDIQRQIIANACEKYET